jgi:hypothetical protein
VTARLSFIGTRFFVFGLQKKQMRDAERKGIMAAIPAAPADGSEDAPSSAGAGAGASAGGLGPRPVPRWPEVAVALEEKRRELGVNRLPAAGTSLVAAAGAGDDGSGIIPVSSGPSSAAAAAAAAAGAASGEPEPTEGEDVVDPALWHCALLNRLELRLPNFTIVSPRLAFLTSLQARGCPRLRMPFLQSLARADAHPGRQRAHLAA